MIIIILFTGLMIRLGIYVEKSSTGPNNDFSLDKLGPPDVFTLLLQGYN
jgi:hypothetical protein